MFGDNANDNTTGQQPFTGDQPTVNPPASSTPGMDMSAPALPGASQPDNSSTPAPSQPDNPQPEVTSTSYGATEADTAASDTSTPAPAADNDNSDNATNDSSASTDANQTPDLTAAAPANSDALLDIKQQALQHLTPLVDHLDQSPSEEFRTTMMMIQATDNQELVQKAFAAAQKIEDDKERAQAFLDIINEINYFTQHHNQEQ